MQIIKKGKTGKYVQIASEGQDARTASWYTIPDSLLQYTKDMVEGDEVSIKFETKPGFKGQSTNFLTYITKGNVTETVKQTPTTFGTGGQKTYGHTPEVQASIRNQAVGHMVARTLIALQGHVTVDNVETLIDKLNTKYQAIVK